MFINALGKHLPLVFSRLNEPTKSDFLELVYLIESARYHLQRLEDLTAGKGKAPENYEFGAPLGDGEEPHRYWRFMAATIEFEGFLFVAKRFLDAAWRVLKKDLGEEWARIDTLGDAVNQNQAEFTEQIDAHPYFLTLKNAWSSWAKDLADLRNYIEHKSPYGGKTTGYSLVSEGGERLILLLPDQIKENGKRLPKNRLTYSEGKQALEYVRSKMIQIDPAFESLIEAVSKST